MWRASLLRCASTSSFITLPSVVRDWLMEQASLSRSPAAPLDLLRSLPAAALPPTDGRLWNLRTTGFVIGRNTLVQRFPANGVCTLYGLNCYSGMIVFLRVDRLTCQVDQVEARGLDCQQA